MGLEIEFEYDDASGGMWSPVRDAGPRAERRGRRRIAEALSGNPLIVHLGIALTALALGAASTAGLLAGRTAASDRTIALLHLAPVNAFIVQNLPTPPPTQSQNVDQLLATPWTNVFDQDVSLSVINDGPDPVTVLGGTISALEFQATALTPASTAPTAAGGVSLLRGRAHFVCGDYPPDRSGTVAQLRMRSADGVIHQEKLVVDRFSEIAEQSVCAQAPTPQILRSTTFSRPSSHTPNTYIAEITVSNRAPFPLRMDLPQAAIQSWTGDGGLLLASSGDTLIPSGGTGTIAVSVTVVDCPVAQQTVSDGFDYDVLTFSDARSPADSAQSRLINQVAPIADKDTIMSYCLTQNEAPGGSG